MASVFPGMDPYLEDPAYWADFHHEFIGALRHEVSGRLPQPYVAKIDEHVTIVDPEMKDRQLVKPDVSIIRKPDPLSAKVTAAVLEVDVDLKPDTVANIVYLDPLTQGYIEIRRRTDQQLITVIEVVSPANKNGGRGQYLEKRELLLKQSVNLVELDLLRGGRRVTFSKPLPSADYFAFISRADRRPACDVYHWSVRRGLPALPFPLKSGEADIQIDLQQVMNSAFERGDYAHMIDYSSPISGPAITGDDAKWVMDKARMATAK